jgi:hypothetical protein
MNSASVRVEWPTVSTSGKDSAFGRPQGFFILALAGTQATLPALNAVWVLIVFPHIMR